MNNVSIPYETKIDDRVNDQSISISYRNIEINNEIDELKLSIPNDAKIVRW